LLILVGSSISHYKILDQLGEGGMGVVYKATDTKLDRTVALKFLAAHLLNDDEAKQRFLREAKASAALHHPNICTVYEVDEAEGKTFLAMALLEGEALEDRIAQGPLPLEDALEFGRQTAEGLEAAHEKGIVHRDIKPANIMVDAKGRATIMDFGLARLTEAGKLTRADQTVGTAAYMSPEQIQGLEVDQRTDIWALGCVLYEMVTGLRPFKGQYDQALAYEIVHEEPEPLTAVRAGVPMELEFIVSKCLAKETEARYADAGEIAKDLRTLSDKLKSGRSTVLRTADMSVAGVPSAKAAGAVESLPPDSLIVRKGAQRALQALAAVATLAFLGLLAIHLFDSPPPATQQTKRFSFPQEGVRAASISPDGRYIALAVDAERTTSLWLRAIGSETAREIPGTQGARAEVRGWSPDSQDLVFATREQIKRVSIAGGDPVVLGTLPTTGGTSFRGVSWTPDGERIVFSAAVRRLWEIPARGGEVDRFFEPGLRVYAPHFLPAGGGPNAMLFQSTQDDQTAQILVLNLETNEHTELALGSNPVYSPQGYVVYGPSGGGDEVGLFALPFSRETLKATGDPFPIGGGGRLPSLAADGTLVYLDGAIDRSLKLAWRSREGRILETVGQAQLGLVNPTLSPDGSKVTVVAREGGEEAIWIHDLDRSTKMRLTFGPVPAVSATWSPSGRELIYVQRLGNTALLMRTAADGSGEAVALTGEARHISTNWSRDGRYLAYMCSDGGNRGWDICYAETLSDGGLGAQVAFINSLAHEANPSFSPDGRYVAYTSDESGRREVYVRSFPDGGDRWQASSDGGYQAVWRGDGRELFYVSDTTLVAVPVLRDRGFKLGRPQPLFEASDLITTGAPAYGVSSDGQRILTTIPNPDLDQDLRPKVRVVENWLEEFRDREQD